MFGLVRWRGVTRVASFLLLAATLSWSGGAFADKVKSQTRSGLDQVLFDPNPGSWRNAGFTASAKANAARRDNSLPARFFTISAVLKRDAESGATESKFASIDAGTKSDAPSLGVQVDYSDEPFGLYLFRAPEGAVWSKWRTIENGLKTEIAEIDHCRADSESCSLEVARFVTLTDRARLAGGERLIRIINISLNDAIRYQNDFDHHGVIDKWSTPIATLKDGTGDCEDYAIAKYAALRQAGVSEADLKVLLVRDTVSNQDHAVVTVRHEGRWLVLDNRWSAIVEASALPRLAPRFSLGEDGVKLFASRYASNLPVESEFELLPASSGMDIASTSGNAAPLLL